MISRLLTAPLLHVALVVSLCLSLCSCDQRGASETGTPRPVQVHHIKLVYPPEARALVMAAADIISRKNIQLSNGAVVRLQTSSYDDLSALNKIGTTEVPAHLWIAPLTSLAASVKRPTQSDITVSDCNSLMSSPLGAVYREIDEFALPTQGNELPIVNLLSPPAQLAARAPHLLVGSPRFTSTGILTALVASSVSTGIPLSNLSPEVVRKGSAEIKKTQSRTRNYFVSDHDTLGWLSERETGDPLAVITTEQAYRSFMAAKPGSNLQFKATTAPAAALDYPICAIVTKSDSAQDVEASKATRLFLASEEFKSLLLGAGFLPAASASDANRASVGAAALELIAQWSLIRQPSSTAFVIDASIKTDRSTIETIRREIKMFIEGRPSPNDLVALISASSNPDILMEPSSNGESLQVALGRLTTSGGNAVRDGIQTALTLFSDLSSANYRRSVIVFTSGKDTSSRTSISQVTSRAMQLVGRKNVDLFVIAFGSRESDFGELPALTKQVGGTFILTDIAALPAQFFPIARRVQ